MHCRVHAGLSNQAQYFSERIRLYSISRVINFPSGNVEIHIRPVRRTISHDARHYIHAYSDFYTYLTCVKRRRCALVAPNRRKMIRTTAVIGVRVMIYSTTIVGPNKCILWEIHEDSYNLCVALSPNRYLAPASRLRSFQNRDKRHALYINTTRVYSLDLISRKRIFQYWFIASLLTSKTFRTNVYNCE